MAVTIQIRNVPEALRRRLELLAADARLSLSAYLLRELERRETERVEEKPTVREESDRR